MDLPLATEDASRSLEPDLLSTPMMEQELNVWRMTGRAPFSELQMAPPNYWQHFSNIDLRLLHHIAGLTTSLRQRGYATCTVWATRMPGYVSATLPS